MNTATMTQEDLFGETVEEVRIMTVKQPYAWAIIFAGKNVENRSKPWAYRGKVLVHAGQSVDPKGVEFLRSIGIEPPAEAFQCGHIVGAVQLDGCVGNSPSVWARSGQWHHLLSSPEAATARVTVRGQLGLTRPAAGWERAFA